METILQDLTVAALVPLCGGYAAWKLMPAAARRSLAGFLLGWQVGPVAWRERLARMARASAGGCGCDGCDGPPAPRRGSAPDVRPIVLHRRVRD